MDANTLKLVTFQDPIFATIQGEGILVGMPSTFIRAWGCDFSCSWCDTKGSWAPGSEARDWTIDEVLSLVSTFSPRHIVITGGNPALQGDAFMNLINRAPTKHHYTVETQGSVAHELLGHCDLLSMSPKLHQWDWDQITGAIPDAPHPAQHVQFKIVVEQYPSIENAVNKLLELEDAAVSYGYSPEHVHLILQPEYGQGRRWLRHVVDVHGQDLTGRRSKIRVMPQFHKVTYVVP